MADETRSQPSDGAQAQPTENLARDLLAQGALSAASAPPTVPLAASPDARTRLLPTPTVGRPLPSGSASSIGPYSLISELGRGGMGAVYFAEERALGPAHDLDVIDPGGREMAGVEAAAERVLRHAVDEHERVV